VSAQKVSICECHGTGTALGDPIEIGALQGVMKGERDVPLLHCGSKSNIAHLESAAGINGIMKCVMITLASVATGNVHLNVLNPNLLLEGYPAFCQDEIVDAGINALMCGVSSFGYGGTNSRADVYGRCVKGPRNTGANMTQLRQYNRDLETKQGLRNRSISSTFHEDLYPGLRVGIMGTWDAWTSIQDMDVTDTGAYVYTLTLGDTRREMFHIVIAGDASRLIYPIMDKADSSVIAAGPDANSQGRHWLIDGRDDGMSTGTCYTITFELRGDAKKVRWAVSRDAARGEAPRRHRYFIAGSWNRSRLEEMSPSDEEPGLHRASFVLGRAGFENFQLVRDADWTQLIYPGMANPTSSNIFAMGPDEFGGSLKFASSGNSQDEVEVQLSVVDGRVTVKTISTSGNEQMWDSFKKTVYYVSGTFNNWSYSAMAPDLLVPGLFKHHVLVGANGCERFQIFVNTDWSGTLSPIHQAIRGSGISNYSQDYGFEAERDTPFVILLDLNIDDRSRMVSFREVLPWEAADHSSVRRPLLSPGYKLGLGIHRQVVDEPRPENV